MIVSRSLLNALRGSTVNCSRPSTRNLRKVTYRNNTRPIHLSSPHSYTNTPPPLPLLNPGSPKPNSPLPHQHQFRLKQSRTLLRPQVRHCSHRRSMCRHQHDADAPGSSFDITQGREILPANVKPIHYHLTLEPNLETFEYKGTVVIE
jgi:aminopeptidase 2